MLNVKTGAKLLEDRSGQPFGEDVSVLRGRRDMHNTDITEADAFVNKVQVNLHMLGTLMLDRVAGEIDHADVVTINNSGTL